MTNRRVRAADGPPLGVIAPFFLVAPLGLVLGGLLLLRSNEITFLAIEYPRTVAVTHALLLGWLTTTIMGATYQLGPAVLGGALLSVRLARIQFWVHVVSLCVFITAMHSWHIEWISAGGSGLILSFVLYAVNVGTAIARAEERRLPGNYVAVSLVFLVATGIVGITWAGTLQHGWFTVTPGRLSAHAHLGLIGWIGVTVMGVSYQLVPMFNVVARYKPKLGTAVLWLLPLGLVLFVVGIATDPPMVLRLVLLLPLLLATVLWAVDQALLLHFRSRRKLEVQGYAVVASLAFLLVAIGFAITAAIGADASPGGSTARSLLAYAAAGVLGWAGCSLIGNSYKILPFLIWFHRYGQLVGRQPVPLMADLYSERMARTVLGAHCLTTVVLIVGAVMGSATMLHAGGIALAGVGIGHLATMVWMFVSHRTAPSVATPPATRTIPS